MNRVPLAFVFGLLLALGGAMEAQVIPPKTQPARKAKKVWTNDDLPERPTAKAAKAEAAPPKAQATGTKSDKPDAPPAELLKELARMEEESLRRFTELESQRDAAFEEFKDLEQQRDAAPSLEAQGTLNIQIQEKQKQLAKIVDASMLARRDLQEIREKKSALLPPFEGDFGTPKPPVQAAKEKEEPKPAPPK